MNGSSQTVFLGTLGLHRGYSLGKVGGIQASHSFFNQSNFYFFSWGSVEEILLAKTDLKVVK